MFGYARRRADRPARRGGLHQPRELRGARPHRGAAARRRPPARRRVGAQAHGRLDLHRPRRSPSAIDDKNTQQGGRCGSSTTSPSAGGTPTRWRACCASRRRSSAPPRSASCSSRTAKIVRCNRRYEEMYGYAPGELVGKPISHALRQPGGLRAARLPPTTCSPAARPRAASAAPAQGRHAPSGRAPTAARSIRSDPLERLGVDRSRTSPSSAAPRRSCSACSPSSRRCSTTSWSASPSRRERKIVRCNRRFEEMFGYAAGRRDRRL